MPVLYNQCESDPDRGEIFFRNSEAAGVGPCCADRLSPAISSTTSSSVAFNQAAINKSDLFNVEEIVKKGEFRIGWGTSYPLMVLGFIA